MSFITPLAVAARTGLAAMRANTVRALLSTLGVVIGSAAVVSVLAVSDGVEIYARSRVRAAGFDRVVLRPITDDLIDGQPVARTHVAALGASDVDSVAPMLGPDEHVVFMRQGFACHDRRNAAPARAHGARSAALGARLARAGRRGGTRPLRGGNSSRCKRRRR